MPEAPYRTIALRRTGLQIHLPQTAFIDFANRKSYLPTFGDMGGDTGALYALGITHEGENTTFSFFMREGVSGFFRSFARGALEGDLARATGNLGTLVEKARTCGINNQWFTPDLVTLADERERDILANQTVQSCFYSTEPNTHLLAQSYGGVIALLRRHRTDARTRKALVRAMDGELIHAVPSFAKAVAKQVIAEDNNSVLASRPLHPPHFPEFQELLAS